MSAPERTLAVPATPFVTRRMALWALVGTALLAVVCYWLFFVRPMGLLRYAGWPLLDLYRLAEADAAARERLIAGYLLLGGLYWMGWRAAQRASGRAAWAVVIGGAAASALLLLFLYPFGAADIFDNIMHGRILGVHGANPFRDVAVQFDGDPMVPYAAWRRTPSAYGPAWEIVAGGLAWLAHQAVGPAPASRNAVVIANVLAFKLAGVAFLAASAATVAVTLRQHAPERALAGVVLLAWNPVILVETVGHGHNDIAMIFWVLVAAWALADRRHTLAVLALVAGTLVKFVPALLLPAAVLIALRDQRDLRSRLRWLVTTAALAILLVVIVYAPFWRGLETLSIARRQALFTSSLPAVIWAALQGPLGRELAAQRVSVVAALATGLFALWQAWRAWPDRSWLSFVRASFHIIMFYLLVTCLWFQSWYAVWPLGLAALMPPGHAARLAALFGYAALAKPLIFEPLWLWQRPLPPKPWRELRLGPAVMALPWLYALLAWIDGKRRRVEREAWSVEREA